MTKTTRIRLLCLLLSSLLVAACSGQVPDNLGPSDGRLAPCPDSPNCIFSQSDREDVFVAPLPIVGTVRDAMACLLDTLQRQDRGEIVLQRADYVHATFRSRVFGFVDDVEFLVDEANAVIHVRSASRLGYSDFGVNRARVERLRAAYLKVCDK